MSFAHDRKTGSKRVLSSGAGASTAQTVAALAKVPQYAVDGLRALVECGDPVSQDNLNCLSDSLLRRHLLDPMGRKSGALRPAADAEPLLRNTLTWRDHTINGRSTQCLLCVRAGTRAHCFECIGRDGFGRPVLYGCPARGASQDVELIVAHVVNVLERVLVREPAAEGKEPFSLQWVLLVDLRGFDTKHISVTLGIMLTRIIQNYYRESLAHAFLMDAPQLFDVMYAPMVPSILPSVKSRIEFVDTNDLPELQQLLQLDTKPYNWLKAALRKHPVRDSFPPFPASQVAKKVSKLKAPNAQAPSSLPFATAMSRMAQRQRTTEEMPRKDQVEAVLYNLSHQYGSPACDEDLEVAADKLLQLLGDPTNPYLRQRNREYDESSDRSMAAKSMADGSPRFSSGVQSVGQSNDGRAEGDASPLSELEASTHEEAEPHYAAVNALGRMASRQKGKARDVAVDAERDPDMANVITLEEEPKLLQSALDLDDTRRRLQGLEDILKGLRTGAIDDVDAALTAAQSHSPSPHHSSRQLPLTPPQISPRSGPSLQAQVPSAATSNQVAAAAPATTSAGLASFPLGTPPGKADLDGSISLALPELRDKTSSASDMRDSDTWDAEAGHPMAPKPASRMKPSREQADLDTEVDLYKYIRLLPRHTEKLAPEGGLATKGGSLNFRVQCVKYCILHPNLVQKVLHFFLAMLIVLGTLTAAAGMQFAADGWVNLALPLAVLPLLVQSVLDAVSAAFLAPLLGIAFCVATVLSRAGLNAAAPLATAAICACMLVAFLVHHPNSPAASVYVGPVLLPPSASGVQILVVVPAAVLYEWLVVTRLLAIHMVHVAFALGYRPIWLFELRALACVSRRMPPDSTAWRGVTWAQQAATVMAPEAARLVEAFEEMYRLPGSAVRFRLVDTAHVDLFAVPSRVTITVKSMPHALNAANQEEQDELNRL